MNDVQPSPTEPAAAPTRTTARQINDTIRYTAFSVFTRRFGLTDPAAATDELQAWLTGLESSDVVVRGLYDVSGFRPDADLMIWWHASTAEALQEATRSWRRTAAGAATDLSWAGFALHRPAEFNKGHVPAFLTGATARTWCTVYPFVRSYDWYLLPEPERREMLVEHGMMGREYTSVLSNTVAAFALGDYEWLLCLESDVLHDIVDLMRHLRASKARMHVREEIPFYTGRRMEPAEVIEVLR